MANLPAVTPQDAALALENARLKAAVHLDLLSEELARRALDPVASVKTIHEAAEFNYKLSGLAAKQTAAAPIGGGFKLTFNFNAARPSSGSARTIDVEPEHDVLENPPAAVSLLMAQNDLQCEAILDE
jgi:hypothetical protein